jgi:hypothetical protein
MKQLLPRFTLRSPNENADHNSHGKKNEENNPFQYERFFNPNSHKVRSIIQHWSRIRNSILYRKNAFNTTEKQFGKLDKHKYFLSIYQVFSNRVLFGKILKKMIIIRL